MSEPNEYFSSYEKHFQRMGNQLPSKDIFLWQIERDFSKPWMRGLDKNAAILDIGCGWGHQLFILRHLGFTNLRGIEIVEDSWRIARQELGAGAIVELADAFQYLVGQNDAFDVIILNDVLEHIPRQGTLELLRLIHGALKPGGIISVRVPNMSSLLASFSRDLDFTHVVGFTEFSLMQALDLAGFSDHRLVPMRPKLFFSFRHPLRVLLRLARALLYGLNRGLHLGLYCLRSQRLYPREYEYNLEIYSQKSRRRHVS